MSTMTLVKCHRFGSGCVDLGYDLQPVVRTMCIRVGVVEIAASDVSSLSRVASSQVEGA